MGERTNVLLVVLDSVRAKNTSLHGYERETTPFLSEFADRSTVYTQARAPSIHSIASHVSMFTGEHVESHGASYHTTQIDPTRTVWHELEAEFGYATGLFTNNRIVSNASNLGESFGHVHEPTYPLAQRLENRIDGTALKRLYFRGYDLFARLGETVGSDDADEASDARAEPDDRSGPEYEHGDDRPDARADGVSGDDGGASGDESTGGLTGALGLGGGSGSGYKTLYGGNFVDAFLDWERRQDGPWAACINLMDAHSPYEPEAEFDRWAQRRHHRIQREEKPSTWETLRGRGWERLAALEHLYDGAIRQTDAVVDELVSALRQRGLLSETLLVVTADHGEAFGERSRLDESVRLRGHKWGIPEVLTHVPLVVSEPGQQEGATVEDVASLTNLPAAIRGAAIDDYDRRSLTDEVVFASTFRLPEEKRSKYASVADIDRYLGPWRAVYETEGESVRKFAQSGDRYLTAVVEGAGETTVSSREPHDRVAEAFDRLSDSDLLTEERSDIDEELEQQLEDLGYIR